MDNIPAKLKITLYFLLIFSLLIFLVLASDFYHIESGENPVIIFVLDTDLGPGSELGHGQLVTDLVYSGALVSEVVALDVGSSGHPDEELYFASLQKIISFSEDNPEYRILVNVSLGLARNEPHYSLIKQLDKNNVQVIAAAGNNDSQEPFYPAGFPQVTAVASANREGKSEYSNYGDYIDFSTPGNITRSRLLYVLGQRLFQNFEFWGTSYSAPRVTGLVANLLLQRPDLNTKEALEIIADTSSPIKSRLYQEGKLGAGLINKDQALKQAVPEYGYLLFFRNIFLLLFLLVIVLKLKEKFGVFSVFVFILLLLFFGPLILFFAERLIIFINQEIKITNIIIYISGLLLSLVIGSWSRKMVVKVYLFFSLGYLMLFEIISLNIILLLFPFIFLLVLEAGLVLITKFTGNYRTLLDRLDGEPKRAQQIAQKKLTGLSENKLKSMITWCVGKQKYVDIFAHQLVPQYGEKLFPVLLVMLKKPIRNVREFAGKCIKELPAEKTVSDLINLLQEKKGAPLQVMEILAYYGPQAEEAKEIVYRFLENNSNMWLRRQALVTLVALSKKPQSLLPLLEELCSDGQELVRMEAEYYYNLIKDKGKSIKERDDEW
ncbi:MAG: S8 family serine peptidase [bacterium]